MTNFKNRMLWILVQKDSYPKCCVAQAERFERLNRESNAACVEIRKYYSDIWTDFIKKPYGRKAGFDFSRSMNAKFGRERMGKFHSLRLSTKNRIDFLKYERTMTEAELRLVESVGADLGECLKFIEAVNDGTFENNESGRWVNMITPKRFAEIMMWKFIQVSK